MDQRGRLQRGVAGVSAQLAGGQAPQLVVDQRQQAIERALVTFAPGGKPVIDRRFQYAHAPMMPALVNLRDFGARAAGNPVPLALR